MTTNNKETLDLQGLHKIRQKLMKSQTISRNYTNESYQEYQFYNSQASHRNLIDTLISLYQPKHTNNKNTDKKQGIQNTESNKGVQDKRRISLLDQLIAQHSHYASCLLSYAQDVSVIVEQQQLVTLSHKHLNSQSVLLALLLVKQTNRKVELVISNGALKASGYMLCSQNEEDHLSFITTQLKEQGITVTDIKQWNTQKEKQQKQQNKDKQHKIRLIDVFALSLTEYQPFLLLSLKQQTNSTVIYHNNLQDDQISHQIALINKQSFPLQLWPQHPLESILQKKQDKALQQLIAFLKEDATHPERQDIVVFYPLQLTSKQYQNKLNELSGKNFIKNSINFIRKPHKKVSNKKNNIFIVKNTNQLRRWNYDYSRIIYVIDYGTDTSFTYNYQHQSYVQSVGAVSRNEKARRMCLVGNDKIGKYVALNPQATLRKTQTFQNKQLSSYILKMIDYGLEEFIEKSNSRIKQCLHALQHRQIISIDKNQGLSIKDEQIVQLSKAGVNPLQAKLILNISKDQSLQEQNRKKLTNLMIMAVVVVHHQENLRKAKHQVQANARIKPNGIWRKSGYIESCLQILTKCELIQNRRHTSSVKSQQFRRKTSKFNENQFDVFGTMFQQIQPKKKTFEDMKDLSDLIIQYSIDEEVLNQMRLQIDDYRDAFGVQPHSLILQKEDVCKVISLYLMYFPSATATYSGSRRTGYTLADNSQGIFPHQNSLIFQLNQRPQNIVLLRIIQSQGRKQVLMCNSFNSDVFMETFGRLPVRRSQSQSQLQLQFHGISNSTFQQLWKHNGSEISKFEAENDCIVQANQQISLIVIHCCKAKGQQIKQKFALILQKIRQKFSVSNKLVHYLGNTNLLLGSGGAIKDLIKADYIHKCLVSNLHLQTTKEDLQQLFEQFVPTKEIAMNEPQPGKFHLSAVVHFHTQKDYYKFHQYFNECLLFDRVMDIKPLKDAQVLNFVQEQQYIDFKWFVWKSHHKALVSFVQEDSAQKALQAIRANPNLDGTQIRAQLQDGNLILDQLSQTTDQIFVAETMAAYGKVREVQILKTPLKQVSGQQLYLQNLIKQKLQGRPNANFKMGAIQKKKNGLRVCRVVIPDLNYMNIVANILDKTIGNLGQSRLYAQTWFQKPTLVAKNSMAIYQQLLQKVIQNSPQKPNIQSYIQQSNKKVYIVLKSRLKATVDYIHKQFNTQLQGYPLELSTYQKSILLTDIGIANILYLQEKFHCKLLPDVPNQTLNIMASEDSLRKIKQQIKGIVDDHFFYRVSLNSKVFKHFKANPQKIQQIRKNFVLNMIQIEADSKALLLQGSALNVQKTFNYLMHFMQSLTVSAQQMVNADVCGICCEQPHQPYRLQFCGHKFCRDCLMQYINSSLGDMSMFPLKCPHCIKQIVVDDLQSLLEQTHWGKVQTMALNQHVSKKAQVMTFCFTAGCKQVNLTKHDHFDCDVCLSSYCLQCKSKHHPGLTCEQAKQNVDQLFKKYLQQNGVRRCPNTKCKIPVIRTDGCYRITCSSCGKSMCFKCQPDKMIAYDHYNECYQHLNDVHGGYW